MPQCPHCQAPYEPGQLSCHTCGRNLPPPEPGDTFCSQCGERLSPGQKSCPACNASLQGAPAGPEAEALKPEPEAPPPQPPTSPQTFPGLPFWLIGLLVGSGVMIITLLFLLFSRGISTPPTPHQPAPAPNTAVAPAPAPAPAAADLKVQLQNVLATLRQAQMHQDIVKFMSVYSLTFPDLETKRATTLKSWEHHDFTNLVFTVDKIQTINPDNAVAWVTWYVDTRDRRSRELSSSTQAYKVYFAREQGKWQICALKEVKP
jgi:hypothetical protein